MYEAIIKALKTNSDTHSNELFKQMQLSKSIEAEQMQEVLHRYSSSADRLEQMLSNIKDGNSSEYIVERLKIEHKIEVDRIKADHQREINKIKNNHSSETNKLLERIKILEKFKLNAPGICEIDLSSAFEKGNDK